MEQIKKTTFLLALLMLSVLSIRAQSDKPRYLKPVNFQKKVTHIISGKSRSYYSLNVEKASVIIVRGPGKLRVMTRGRFTPETKGSIKYEVRYTVDGGDIQKVKFSGVRPSGEAVYLNEKLGKPGTLEDFEIPLGRGYHTLAFFLSDREVAVAARYKFIPGKEKKQEWISYAPLSPVEPVDLITNEQIVHYYRFSTEKPLTVEVNGPTQLRMMTRIENHYDMKGRIHYRIQVTENGKVINTYQLSSTHSQVTKYKDDKELVPGKAREFVIDVPRGKHKYEIHLLDKDKNSVLGRFLLPKKDVKLTK